MALEHITRDSPHQLRPHVALDPGWCQLDSKVTGLGLL
jgi:hypothetical protein